MTTFFKSALFALLAVQAVTFSSAFAQETGSSLIAKGGAELRADEGFIWVNVTDAGSKLGTPGAAQSLYNSMQVKAVDMGDGFMQKTANYLICSKFPKGPAKKMYVCEVMVTDELSKK